jgi:hypothetical protein
MDPAAMLVQQNDAIKKTLKELNAAAEAYSKVCENNAGLTGVAQAGEVAQSHVQLQNTMQKMKAAVYGPFNMVTAHFEEFCRSGCFRTLLEMGVFDTLPADGSPMSAVELSEKLNVEEALLVRLMRMVVPSFFAEPQPEVYTHTANSLVYLFPPLRGGFTMMFDEFGPPAYKLADFFKKNGYKNPEDLRNNPFTFAHNASGLTMFEVLAQDPVRFKNFNDGMQAQTSQTVQSYGFFPFEEAYKRVNTDNETVLLVDVGGGKGQASSAIRALCPGIPGRIILQDRPDVIAGITEEIQGVEKMGYDFFTPQPIKGAIHYYIRRCLHDWPEPECLVILKNIAAAMTSQSKLLVAEIVLTPGETDIETAWMDITMMTFGGMERSEKQWKELLTKAGLKLEKVYRAEGTNFSVLEAALE